MHPQAKSNWAGQPGAGAVLGAVGGGCWGSGSASCCRPDVDAVRLAAVQQSQHSVFLSMAQTMPVCSVFPHF